MGLVLMIWQAIIRRFFEFLWKAIEVLERAFHHCHSAARRPGERGHWALITEAVAFVCGHKSAEER